MWCFLVIATRIKEGLQAARIFPQAATQPFVQLTVDAVHIDRNILTLFVFERNKTKLYLLCVLFPSLFTAALIDGSQMGGTLITRAHVCTCVSTRMSWAPAAESVGVSGSPVVIAAWFIHHLRATGVHHKNTAFIVKINWSNMACKSLFSLSEREREKNWLANKHRLSCVMLNFERVRFFNLGSKRVI